MAQRKKTARKRKKPAYIKLFIRKMVSLMQDKRSHRIAGLACWLCALFLLIAFVSYLFTWREDQSYVFDSPWSILFSAKELTHNLLGRLGSFLSHVFIYKWFGLASFIFIIIFGFTGSKLLLKNTRFQLARSL